MSICKKDNYLYKDKIEFIQSILNKHCVVSKDFIDKKNWIAMPVPENLDMIESEWLSDAIHRFGFTTYEQYIIGIDNNIEFSEIINNQENICNSEYDYLDRCVILTNKNIDFLYYKDINNLYHMFAGTYDFVYSCVQCSMNLCKRIYTEYRCQYVKGSPEYKKCEYIWNLYQ
ncbi:hypothetical protein [Snodgrassella alvi]|jgi:hypothetical protein|uniref:Uncharacterized protein n=1 Tax=Snodgrassella alvi TaxID=1196083 RepID=A0A855FXS7_9NEIS|nr:hypothetical protein [Snodgrassella alvi]PIT43995.1 hypothetical protein BHC51_10180 [Snodgrassella alvi]PIT60334.1 hypothetical protein BHC57_04250 [Snodgrassella alvi]